MRKIVLCSLSLCVIVLLVGCDENKIADVSKSNISTTVTGNKVIEDEKIEEELPNDQVNIEESTVEVSNDSGEIYESNNTEVHYENNSDSNNVHTDTSEEYHNDMTESDNSGNEKSGCQVYNPITGGCED